MSFLTQMSTDNATVTNYWDQSAANSYVVGWVGQQHSIFDGYEWEEDRDQHAPFEVDTQDWPHRIQWGNDHRFWIKVTVQNYATQWETYQTTTAGTDTKEYNFYYTWHGGSATTQNFSPICEEAEVAPETFMKWLEQIGHDYAFLRMNHRMQKKMMKDIGQLPPWDPRKITELEERAERFRTWLDENDIETKEKAQAKMKERWGIEEIPPMTPELLDQIAAKSLEFLDSCLSPEERKFFDEHGHCKIPSSTDPEVYYIVKVTDQDRVERYEKDQLTEKICIHSRWSGLPPLDTVAMKALYIKNAEEEFLKAGNRTRMIRAVAA